MAIQTAWGDPAKTVVHITFQRGWTWPELQEALQQADDLITSVPHMVHVLIDIRQAGGLPRDFISAASDLFAEGAARPNEGKKVVVGAGTLIRAAYGAFLTVYGAQMKDRPFLFAAAPEDALRIIQENQPDR